MSIERVGVSLNPAGGLPDYFVITGEADDVTFTLGGFNSAQFVNITGDRITFTVASVTNEINVVGDDLNFSNNGTIEPNTIVRFIEGSPVRETFNGVTRIDGARAEVINNGSAFAYSIVGEGSTFLNTGLVEREVSLFQNNAVLVNEEDGVITNGFTLGGDDVAVLNRGTTGEVAVGGDRATITVTGLLTAPPPDEIEGDRRLVSVLGSDAILNIGNDAETVIEHTPDFLAAVWTLGDDNFISIGTGIGEGGATITSSGRLANALQLQGDRQDIDLGPELTVTTTGEESSGLVVFSVNEELEQDFAQAPDIFTEAAITVQGRFSDGVDLTMDNGTFVNGGAITLEGALGIGLSGVGDENSFSNASGGRILTKGEISPAAAFFGNDYSFVNSGAVRTEGILSPGVIASGSEVRIENQAGDTIVTTGANSIAVQLGGVGRDLPVASAVFPLLSQTAPDFLVQQENLFQLALEESDEATAGQLVGPSTGNLTNSGRIETEASFGGPLDPLDPSTFSGSYQPAILAHLTGGEASGTIVNTASGELVSDGVVVHFGGTDVTFDNNGKVLSRPSAERSEDDPFPVAILVDGPESSATIINRGGQDANSIGLIDGSILFLSTSGTVQNEGDIRGTIFATVETQKALGVDGRGATGPFVVEIGDKASLGPSAVIASDSEALRYIDATDSQLIFTASGLIGGGLRATATTGQITLSDPADATEGNAVLERSGEGPAMELLGNFTVTQSTNIQAGNGIFEVETEGLPEDEIPEVSRLKYTNAQAEKGLTVEPDNGTGDGAPIVGIGAFTDGIDVLNSGFIDVTGPGATGIEAKASVDGVTEKILNDGQIFVTGDDATGVSMTVDTAAPQALFEFRHGFTGKTDPKIEVSGKNATGVEIEIGDDQPTELILELSRFISATGENARGVVVNAPDAAGPEPISLEYNLGDNGAFGLNRPVSVSVEGENSVGVEFRSDVRDIQVIGGIFADGQGAGATGLVVGTQGNQKVTVLSDIEVKGSILPDQNDTVGMRLEGGQNTVLLGRGEQSIPDFENLSGGFANPLESISFGVNIATEFGGLLPRAQIDVEGIGAIGLTSTGGNTIILTAQESEPEDGEEPSPPENPFEVDYEVRDGLISNVIARGQASVGVQLGDGDTLINGGTIDANGTSILGNAGTQKVANTGNLFGDVFLGGGADTFLHAVGANVPQNVDGGTGDDLLIVELLTGDDRDASSGSGSDEGNLLPRDDVFSAAGSFRSFETVEFRAGIDNPQAVGSAERIIRLQDTFAPGATKVVLGTGVTLVIDGTTGADAVLSAAEIAVGPTTKLELDNTGDGDAQFTGIVKVAAGGELAGAGTIGDLDADPGAIIAPGFSPGTLTITGNATIEGDLIVEIGGEDAGSFDKLVVTGTLDLSAATVQIRFIDDYAPPPDAVFDLFEAGTLIGLDTADVQVEGLPDDLQFNIAPDGSSTVTDDEPENSPPVPGTLNLTVTEDDDPFALDLLSGATDSDGDLLSVIGATVTASDGRPLTDITELLNETLQITPDGFDDLAQGTDVTLTVNYDITDGINTTPASAIVTVQGQNDAPVAFADAFSVDEGGSVSGSVLEDNSNGADADVDGDTLSVLLVDDVDNGVLELNADGTFTYAPTDDFAGTDTFIYDVMDGKGGTDRATVTFTVNEAPNQSPEVSALTAGFGEDETGRTVNLLDPLFVFDQDGDDLDVENVLVTADDGRVVSATTDPETGVFSIGDGQFEDLEADASLLLTINYDVTDGIASVANTATATISGVNDAPTAIDDAGAGFETEEETAFVIADLLANDVDPDGDVISLLELDTTATTGIVTILENGDIRYDPNGSFDALDDDETGTDTFLYTISDSNGGQDIGEVTVEISGLNDAPVALDDFYEADAGSELSDNVLLNDSDIDGDTLTASLVSGAGKGELDFGPDGSFTYRPDPDASGTDSFVYSISDGDLSTTATVNLTIEPLEDPTGNFAFTLVNTRTDETVASITQGETVDRGSTSSFSTSIVADWLGEASVESMTLSIADADGNILFSRTENVEPYALFGDRRGDFFDPRKPLPEGAYSITAKAYSGDRAGGELVEETTLDFVIADDSTPSESFGVFLVDTVSDDIIAEILPGANLTPANTPGDNLSVRVDVEGAESVRLALYDSQGNLVSDRIENVEPYALFGDRNGNFFNPPDPLTADDYRLEIAAFSENSGRGTEIDRAVVDFTLSDVFVA
ncbi:MAG: Ig-like domain-containing protein [Pseudomonadota bacterium]